jgi:hypothetical protein
MINNVSHTISVPTISGRAGEFLSLVLLALSVALTMVTLASA